jgi:hypothetical protein
MTSPTESIKLGHYLIPNAIFFVNRLTTGYQVFLTAPVQAGRSIAAHGRHGEELLTVAALEHPARAL